MERLYREYMELLGNLDFRKFQLDLSQKIYDTLAQGYISNDNEILLVSRLVEAVNNLKFKKFEFFAHKIHGARSYVEFNYRDKPITKEVADMVILPSDEELPTFKDIFAIDPDLTMGLSCEEYIGKIRSADEA